ncbi:TetR/AcrR family transcriptional regulator [Lederbergia panacisoli]|uniref:TetR/AcrR family transcriptional regulator n=1 Tax=Lederbergia panacisoli TaxID=1255251 RepID=UPI00214BC355|nr:TetR/AcrR family transcriptional regulator [Lederbergia panacisoli]MCR2823779.1 TetR/AcrR family transcriptional regulator [Lederbergia panacisoli]
MTGENTDLRSIRTRKFIFDSFVELLEKKEFNSITISDITTGAMINRATFYRHFLDKFDLLEKVIKEDLLENVLKELSNNEEFSEEMLKSLFLSITTFHMSLSTRCQRSYHDMSVNIEALLKKELEQIIFQSLLKKYQNESIEMLRMNSTMLGWMVYGASIDWKQNSNKSPEEYLEDASLSIRKLLKSGIN